MIDAMSAPPPVASPPVAATPASLDDGFLIAGRNEATQQFFVARVTPSGVTEISHEAAEPTQLVWVDAHILVAMTELPIDGSDASDTRLRWYIDGVPNDRRGKTGEVIQAAVWPVGFRGATSRLMVTRSGQVWVARKRLAGEGPGEDRYLRVDAMPRKLQQEPPADLDVARSNLWPLGYALIQDDVRAKLDALPKAAAGPDGASLALTQVAGGTPGVACKDGKRASSWPSRSTHRFVRLHVQDAHWLSATLPLWIAIGHNPDHPDGDVPGNVAFLGCNKEPLSDFRWLGGDVWATRDGGAWSDPKDAKRWVIWNGARKLATTEATSSVFEAAPR